MSNNAKLSDHIKVLSEFQYSINIEYDLYSDVKIQNYIPTTGALDIIEDVMLSTWSKSADRSRIFVGAYGKGKSHLALILIALLCRKEKRLYKNLLNTIQKTKPELSKYIVSYQNSKQKLLPVVIQGSSVGIRQSFLLAIKKSLQENGMGSIMPNTYFSAAIDAINIWKEKYQETYQAFKKHIHCSITEFINELRQFNNRFYEEFVSIYPALTSGSEFNPVQGMNIVDLYNDVNEKIQDYGYTGIFVVYDEFSKFLSGNLRKTSIDEVEVLQYFAESCNRSGDRQMHIMLISHQSILNYVDNLPKSKVDSWKAVSDRFKPIELNTSASQMYEITARVIQKDNTWFAPYAEEHQDKFNALQDKWSGEKLFSELTQAELKNVIWGCYPLEPVSTFLLPRISEKVAQNERTLFTFLSSDGQKHTLTEFIKKSSPAIFPLLTPDFVYDYFEPLFKAEAYDRPIHKLWKTASVALNKIERRNLLGAKIIKTIALIYILDRIDILPPDIDTILSIYGAAGDLQNVITTLTELTNSGILRKLDHKNHLRINESSEKNIDAQINDKIEEKKLSVDVQGILNRFAGQQVLYPNAYNDDHEIVRYFDFQFLSASVLCEGSHFVEMSDGAAGVVYAVITQPDEFDDTLEAIKSFTDERIVFIVPKENEDIGAAAYKYDAIVELIGQSDDEIFIDELSYSLNDVESALQRYIDSFLCPESGHSIYYSSGEIIPIHRKSALSRKLSDICSHLFSACPIINNEVINKNQITAQATNSRAKLVDGILANDLKPNLGLFGSGQDVSFMRSTLKVTGIYVEDDFGAALTITGLPDQNLENVLAIIKDFMIGTSGTGRASFSALYERLINPEYHIGMKKGVIPVYIAVVLHFFKKYIIITRNKREMEINARLLEAINDTPEEYDLYLEKWSPEKEEYIQTLEKAFTPYIRAVEKEYNNFEYIVQALQRWYLQLPKYVKEIRSLYLGTGRTQSLDIAAVRFLNSLRAPELNARDYLFDKILWVFGRQHFDSGIALQVQALKDHIDHIKHNLISALAEDLKVIFGKRQTPAEASLPSVIADWISTLDSHTKAHVFSNNDTAMLRICCEATPDYARLVEDLGRAATGLRIDDWGEITVEGFLRAVSDFVHAVDAYNLKVNQSENQTVVGSYKLSFFDDSGAETFKTYEKTELPDNAQLLYNDVEAMLTEEYGASLSDNEKRQVLIDIITKLLS